MATDYYGDEPSAPEAEPADDTQDEGEQTALLPKSLFGGKECKPGDTITLTVKSVYEDEIEVGPAAKTEEPAKPKSSMEQADSSLDAMAKPREA